MNEPTLHEREQDPFDLSISKEHLVATIELYLSHIIPRPKSGFLRARIPPGAGEAFKEEGMKETLCHHSKSLYEKQK